MSEIEEIVVRFWGIACMAVGLVIGWELHGYWH
jgi:uncharacterized protein YjeT (DUF2065 family)